MKKRNVIVCVVLSVALCSCTSLKKQWSANRDQVLYVGLPQLLAHPERYHKKKICLDGYLVLDGEIQALFLTKEHADHMMGKSAIWIWIDPQLYGDDHAKGAAFWKQYTETHVDVVGRFDKNDMGHFASYSGALWAVSVVKLTRHDTSNKFPDPISGPARDARGSRKGSE